MCSLEDIAVVLDLDLDLLSREKCVNLYVLGVTTVESVMAATGPYIGHRRSGRQEMKRGMIGQKRTNSSRGMYASQPHFSIFGIERGSNIVKSPLSSALFPNSEMGSDSSGSQPGIRLFPTPNRPRAHL
jgi:hypothetical protein